MSRMRVLVMGPPGGGKGTVGKMMQQDFGFAIVSTGDALREAIRLNKPEGQQAKAIIQAGNLVPDVVMSAMLRGLLSEHSKRSWVLDGYPRTLAQAKILEGLLGSGDLDLPLDAIFNLNVPFDLVFQRLSGRWVHPQSGRIYNEHFSPPKVKMLDDETSEQLVRRPDDEPESVRRRLVVYQESTAPILEFFGQRFGPKLHMIDCETSKEGYAKVKPILQSIAATKK